MGYSIVALCGLAVAACGGGDGGDDGGPPEGDFYYYVANDVRVPTSTTEAQTYGLDIDCGEASMDDCPDGTDIGKDNQLGSVLAALAGMNIMVQATIDESVDMGDILILVRFQTTDFSAASRSGLQVYLGDSNQITPAPPGHLGGTGQFVVASNSPTNALVVGPVVNSVFKGGPGNLTLQIALAAGNPIPLNLIGARAEARTISATGIGSGVLAGAIPKTDIDNNIIPAIQQQLVPLLAEYNCTGSPPGCGCDSGSTGATLISLFDNAPADCMISVDEIKNNNLIMSLLAPDVTIDGVDALSVGIGFSTVAGTFTAP